jgi:hypothetical protein
MGRAHGEVGGDVEERILVIVVGERVLVEQVG